MMRKFIALLREVPVVWVDGLTYVFLQGLTFLSTAFSGEDSYKYINPYLLFWLKIVCGEGAAMLLAFKVFRSTAYSQYKEKQKHDDETRQFTRQPTP